jgi:uncharacterized protein YaeQ
MSLQATIQDGSLSLSHSANTLDVAIERLR